MGLAITARPIRPLPSSPSVPGSGTSVALTVPTPAIKVLISLVVVTAVILMVPLIIRVVGTRLAEIVVATRLNGAGIVRVLIVPLVRVSVNIGIVCPDRTHGLHNVPVTWVTLLDRTDFRVVRVPESPRTDRICFLQR